MGVEAVAPLPSPLGLLQGAFQLTWEPGMQPVGVSPPVVQKTTGTLRKGLEVAAIHLPEVSDVTASLSRAN